MVLRLTMTNGLEFIGDESWSYAKLQKQFRKMELYTPSEEHPLVDKSHRGLEGLMAST
jgi:hypothetical protein